MFRFLAFLLAKKEKKINFLSTSGGLKGIHCRKH